MSKKLLTFLAAGSEIKNHQGSSSTPAPGVKFQNQNEPVAGSSRSTMDQYSSTSGESRLPTGGSTTLLQASAQKKKHKSPSRMKKDAEYHAKVKADKIRTANLPTVIDPKEKPENQDYFQHAKQINMGFQDDNLESDIPDTLTSPENLLKNWTSIKSMVDIISPSDLSKSPPVDYSTPHSSFKGYPIYWIDSTSDPLFEWMIRIIKDEKSVAVDIENHNSHSFLGMTALLQLATRSLVFIIDPHSCFRKIQTLLKPVLEDEAVLKIFHGMANDYKNIVKDFGIQLLGVLDLQQLHNQLREDGQKNLISLDNLARDYIGNQYEPTASYTLTDWRRRPLTQEMIKYAANDVIVVVEVWESIKGRMKKEGLILKTGFTATTNMMINARQQFKLKQYPSALEDFRTLNIKVDDALENILAEFELLHQWRERYAAIVDEEPSLIASTYHLLKIVRLPFERFSSPDELKQHQKEGTTRYTAAIKSIQSVGLPRSTTNLQSHTILRVLISEVEFFTRLDGFQCRNCMKYGHALPHCPFERLSATEQERRWGAAHPEYKRYQQQRRKTNLNRNKKFGNKK